MKLAIAAFALVAFPPEALAQDGRCLPGPGTSGAPQSIEQAVALINSLPRPVTIPCLVESLARPLKVFATRSSASLQSSTGPEDPRFFIFSGPLIISVTSDGPGADLVEMSVVQPGERRSLKGELRFPVTGTVAESLPYQRIRDGGGTTCAVFCHRDEARDARIGFAEAFVSRAIRPSPASEVSLEYLAGVQARCKGARSSARCELLHAILADGGAERQDFPAAMPTGF